jgi:hypothetical protein
MGFGYGGSQARSGIRRYSNSQLAHVWNTQTEAFGQTDNGNAYFERAALYSYGSHFLTGYIMPDGVALLNADSYSITTSGHQSDARGAVSNRPTFYIAGLTELRPLLSNITEGKLSAQQKSRARDLIRTHAEALAASHRCEPGTSRWQWNEELGRSEPVEGGESAGEYLTRAAGLPARSWPKLAREAAANKAKREARDARLAHDRKQASAKVLADMSDAEFRQRLAVIEPAANRHSGYKGEAERRLKQLALDLLRAVKTANAEGFSKRRLNTLKARRKLTAARLAVIGELERIVFARQQLRSDVALIRAIAEQWRGVDDMPSDYWRLRTLEDGAKALALRRPSRLPAGADSRLRRSSSRRLPSG